MKNLVLLGVVLLASLAVSAQKQQFVQPDFSAATMDGQKMTLSQYRGKVVVLNLWFINCPNCLSEIKELNSLVAEYKDNKNVVFLAPASSRKADLVKFLKKTPFAYQVIPDAGTLIISKFATPNRDGTLGMPFPMHYVIDRDGVVKVKVEGTKGIVAVRDELKRQLAARKG